MGQCCSESSHLLAWDWSIQRRDGSATCWCTGLPGGTVPRRQRGRVFFFVFFVFLVFFAFHIACLCRHMSTHCFHCLHYFRHIAFHIASTGCESALNELLCLLKLRLGDYKGGLFKGGGGLETAVKPLCCHICHFFEADSLKARHAPCLYLEHSGNILGTFWEHSENILGTFRKYSGNIKGTFGELSGNIWGTFSEHLV
jgi:hypothetical protein